MRAIDFTYRNPIKLIKARRLKYYLKLSLFYDLNLNWLLYNDASYINAIQKLKCSPQLYIYFRQLKL
jgi:hypothetical protein